MFRVLLVQRALDREQGFLDGREVHWRGVGATNSTAGGGRTVATVGAGAGANACARVSAAADIVFVFLDLEILPATKTC